MPGKQVVEMCNISKILSFINGDKFIRGSPREAKIFLIFFYDLQNFIDDAQFLILFLVKEYDF